MPFSSKRDLITTPIYNGEILSDGLNVWVNIRGVCKARFSNLSYEVDQGTTSDGVYIPRLVTPTRATPKGILGDWETFKEQVYCRGGTLIGHKHCPTYLLKFFSTREILQGSTHATEA
jgi:hypothetical protein